MATAANSAWLASCLPEYRRFRNAFGRVAEEQAGVLNEILRKNEESEFGRCHAFSKIRDVREYREHVPLREYEDYRGCVDRIAKGDAQVLTCEPVRLFEPTSGSASAAKWIPYTASLQKEFQRGIRAWVADMFLHNPSLLHGAAYWSVSPAETSIQVTPSGIPVGFADDSEYVGGLQRKLVQSVMAVPASIRKLGDMEAFWYTTLLHLVRCPNLRLISVWSPSFLTLLMDRLSEYYDRLAHDVPALKSTSRASTPGERHALLWPHLRMISCWTDGNSALAARRLTTLFPQARICGKGLIATEGFVSFPWEAREAAVLAVRSHFLEFLPADSNGDPDASHPQLTHELERGQHYSVVVTTGGGLYRYHLGDLVEVVGQEQQCPLVRFIGRRQIADWCGEKLHEAHVTRVLADAFDSVGVMPSFAMLACDTSATVPNYVLYLEAAVAHPQSQAGVARAEHVFSQIAESIESGLQENFHYRYACELGQLGRLRIFAARNAEASYLAECIARGQRAGNVKSVALDSHDGWTEKFDGHFVENRIAAGTLS